MAEIQPEYLSYLINEIDNPIIITNSNFEIEWVSRSFTKTYGYTLEEFINTRGASLLKSSYNSSISSILEEAIKQKASIKYESPNVTKDGKELWISSTIKPVFDSLGAREKIIVIDLNVHEQKKLQDRMVLTDSILNRVGSLILVANSYGEIVYVSPSVSKTFGYSVEELLDSGWWNLKRNEDFDIEKERNYIADCAAGVTAISEDSVENIIYCKDGSYKWILWKNTKGPDNLLIGVAHDITERKKNEEVIHSKNKEITDSIKYAHGIQNVILPSSEVLYNNLPENFVLFKPKDIVSGDFYWYTEVKRKLETINTPHSKKNKESEIDYNHLPCFLIAAADCTGHGVPGALMSIVGMSLLKEVVNEKSSSDPAMILRKLNKNIKMFLKQTGETNRNHDGLDIGLLALYSIFDENSKSKKVVALFAGANRPLFLFRQNKLQIFNGNKTSIGGITDSGYKFHSHKIGIEPGDVIYLFTDGYADQFGGLSGKKILTRRLRELMESIHVKQMHEQENIFSEVFETWKGKCDQVDDVLLIGLKF